MKPEYKNLSLFLNVFAVISTVLFVGLFLGTLFDTPALQDGGALRFMRWEPLSKHVELMLEIVYIVMAVFLFLAAKKPEAYISFINFVIWSNLAHGLLMVFQSLTMPHFHYKMFTDVAYCLVLAIGLMILKPGTTEKT
jgi:hypothetical protein